MREWIAAVKLAEELKKFDVPCPDIENDMWKLECTLPIQLGLPCKCFLYHCLIRGKPLTPSLIHPRWFLDWSLYVSKNGWRMRYSNCQVENQMPEDFQEKKMPSDRYQEHGMALLEELAIESLDYAKTLTVHERAKAFQEFNALFQARKAKQALVLTTFVDPIRPKDVCQKKRKRRGLTLREALDKKEADKRRQRRAQSVEQAQIQKHLALTQTYKAQTNEFGSFSQNSNPGFERQCENVSDADDLPDVPDYDSDNMPAQPKDEDNDDDLQYLGTQATNIVGKNSKNNQAYHYSSAQGESNSDSDNLEDIDKLLSQSIPPRLVSLSQNLTANQLPPSTAPAMT